MGPEGLSEDFGCHSIKRSPRRTRGKGDTVGWCFHGTALVSVCGTVTVGRRKNRESSRDTNEEEITGLCKMLTELARGRQRRGL